MTSGTTENPLDININHNVTKDVIGFFPKAWRATKKYSVNNTLPIAAVNAWLQFSLAYVVAIMITSNDLSFITNIFNPQAMSAYALVSVILGIVLLTSLTLKYMSKQEIKEEKLINDKIRGDKDNEISKIAENALKIEITPDLSLIGHKKENFSIVLPIAEEQSKILESQKEENRNKIIFLTIPCAINAAIIVGALIQNRFNFSNVQGGEWGFIAFVSAVSIVGICITLSKSRNNEINNNHNIVKNFNNIDILLPWRKGSVISVMEKKTKDEEENDPISRLIKLLDKRLTHLVNEVCYLFDNSLSKIEKTLDSIKEDIKTLLDNLEERIQQNVDGVEATANEAIIQCLENIDKSVDELCKGVGKDVQKKLDKISIKDLVNNLSRLAETFEDRISRLKPGSRMGLSGAVFADERLPNAPGGRENGQLPQDEQASSDEIPDAQRVDWKKGVKEIGQLKKKIKALERTLEKKENNQNQHDSGNSSSSSESIDSITNSLEEQRNVLRKENKDLKLQQEIKDLQEENAKLKKEFSEQEEINKWQKNINGNLSDFLYYLLESIKLEEKDDKEKKVEATLRNFDNKIIIHWKDGSQTTCYINEQGDLQVQPSTKVDFVDQNIQAAFAIACAG